MMAVIHIKAVVVGSNAVGKSAIVSRLISNDFVDDYEPTVYEHHYTKSQMVENEAIDTEIIDTSGQQQYEDGNESFRSGDIFVIVYSINDLESFKETEILRDRILNTRDNMDEFPLVIVGNKCDLKKDRQIPTISGQQLANEWKCPFIETSAKNNKNIGNLFEEIVREYREFMDKHQVSMDDKQDDIDSNISNDNMNCIQYLCNSKEYSSLIHRNNIEFHAVNKNANIDHIHKPILIFNIEYIQINKSFNFGRFIVAILFGLFLPLIIILQTIIFVTYCDNNSDSPWCCPEIYEYDNMHHSLLLDFMGPIIGRYPDQNPDGNKDGKWFLKQSKSQKICRILIVVLICVLYGIWYHCISNAMLESIATVLCFWIFWVVLSVWIACEPHLEPSLPPITDLKSVHLYFGEDFKNTTTAYSFLRSYLFCGYSKLKPSILTTFIIICLSLLYASAPIITHRHMDKYNISLNDIGAFIVNFVLIGGFMLAMNRQYRRWNVNFTEWMHDLTMLLNKEVANNLFVSLSSRSNALCWLEIRSYILMEGKRYWCQQQLIVCFIMILSILLSAYLLYETFGIQDEDPLHSVYFNFGIILYISLLAMLIRISVNAFKLAALQKKQQKLISQQDYGSTSTDNKDSGYLDTVFAIVVKQNMIPRIFNVRITAIISRVIVYIITTMIAIAIKLLPLWYPIVIVSVGVLCLVFPCIIAKFRVYLSKLQFVFVDGHYDGTQNKDETKDSSGIISRFVDNTQSQEISVRVKNNKTGWRKLSISYWNGKMLQIYMKPNITPKLHSFNVNLFEAKSPHNEIYADYNNNFYDDMDLELNTPNYSDYQLPPRRHTFNALHDFDNDIQQQLHEEFEQANNPQIVNSQSLSDDKSHRIFIIDENQSTVHEVPVKSSICSEEKEYSSDTARYHLALNDNISGSADLKVIDETKTTDANSSRPSSTTGISAEVYNSSLLKEINDNENEYECDQSEHTFSTSNKSIDSNHEFDPFQLFIIQEIVKNEKELNDNNHISKIEAIMEKILILKQHRNYKRCIRYNKKLSNEELIALIYFCDDTSYYHKIKDIEWKQLNLHLINAVDKLHYVYHYKNKKQIHHKYLYHGCDEFLFSNNIAVFTSKLSTVKQFATGILLIINHAYGALYSGTLKGADISWISQSDKYIILNVKFNHFREMSNDEIQYNEWNIRSDINVYISNVYKSTIDPSDSQEIVSSTMDFSDSDEVKVNDNNDDNDNNTFHSNSCQSKFEDWLSNKVRLKQYLPLFQQNEYNDVTMIEFMDQETMTEIGIIKKIHAKLILKKANQFKQSQDEFITFLEENKPLKKYKDTLEGYGIVTLQDLRDDITSALQLGNMLNIKNVIQLNSLWNIICGTEHD